MGARPSWLATRRSQEVPYVSGSPSFNVLVQSGVEQDWLSICFVCFHELFPATFATVKISSGVHLCVIPSLHYSFPACGPANVWFSPRCPTPGSLQIGALWWWYQR